MSRFLRNLALAGGAALMLGGCFKIDYTYGPSNPAPSYDNWHHIGIFGLVEFSDPVNLDAVCPNGFGRVHYEVSFINGLIPYALNALGGLGWVYQPSTIRVYCRSGAAWELGMTSEGMVASAMRLPDENETSLQLDVEASPIE